jgi:thioredoxin-dependent peroxiredoxin
MAKITLRGTPAETNGELPEKGGMAPDFQLIKTDLQPISLADFKGKRVILNIFPSVDTGVCATSVREFNKRAGALNNTEVVCVSRDLPFAFSRFCGAEGIDKVMAASDFRSDEFSKNYGTLMTSGPLAGLHARSVVVIDEAGKVAHVELVSDIVNEPDYEAAFSALS